MTESQVSIDSEPNQENSDPDLFLLTGTLDRGKGEEWGPGGGKPFVMAVSSPSNPCSSRDGWSPTRASGLLGRSAGGRLLLEERGGVRWFPVGDVGSSVRAAAMNSHLA